MAKNDPNNFNNPYFLGALGIVWTQRAPGYTYAFKPPAWARCEELEVVFGQRMAQLKIPCSNGKLNNKF